MSDLNRLLIVSRCHTPHGGADRIIADLCRELPQRGWQVTLGLTRGNRFNQIEPYRAIHGDLPILEIDGRMGTRGADIVLSMRVFDAYEAVARLKAADINSAPRLAVGVRAFEAPYISDVRRCQANIDFCVTSGRLIAEACREIGGMPEERVESIGGGVHPPRSNAKPKSPAAPIRLLYAGRIERPQKRAEDIIPLVKWLDRNRVEFKLDICGDGPEEPALAVELQSFIERGSVQMHGWVNQDRLYSHFYPHADCFIHFAAWEGVTIAPREAMAHGVVPVISEFIGLHTERQFVNELNSLTFPVGSPEIAASQVRRLQETPQLLRRLSAAAIKSQTGRYSFEGALDAWCDALDRCLELPAKRGGFPRVPERLHGRLTRFGVPTPIQSCMRTIFKMPVSHQSPGSEWPTASGLASEAEIAEVAEFGYKREAQRKREGAA